MAETSNSTNRRRFLRSAAGALAGISFSGCAAAQGKAAAQSSATTLFKNLKLFDGVSGSLRSGFSVLVQGDKIAAVEPGDAKAPDGATVIDCGGRTLMPGLIDVHTHLMFASLPQIALLTSDLSFVALAAAREAEATLMRGFTSVRDLGGRSSD